MDSSGIIRGPLLTVEISEEHAHMAHTENRRNSPGKLKHCKRPINVHRTDVGLDHWLRLCGEVSVTLMPYRIVRLLSTWRCFRAVRDICPQTQCNGVRKKVSVYKI